MFTDKKWLSLCSKEKNDRMALGYAYPAYECFKAVEMNKPEIEQLRFWCQYWILVAALTVFERVGDIFISWLPMYSEAKLAFFVYLWFPKTRGTTYVYESFLRPYVSKHETEIDRNLMELRTRAGDLIVIYWQKAATYGQTRVFEVLQYVASQSPSAHQPPPQQQQQQSGVRRPPPSDPSARPPPDPSTRPPAELSTHPPATSQQSQHSTLRTASTSAATAKQQEPSNNADPPSSKQPAAFHQVRPPAQSEPESSNQQPETLKKGTTQSSDTLAVTNGNGNPSPPEIVMEAASRVTRGRLRKTQAPTNPS